jgi:hypothetical protein
LVYYNRSQFYIIIRNNFALLIPRQESKFSHSRARTPKNVSRPDLIVSTGYYSNTNIITSTSYIYNLALNHWLRCLHLWFTKISIWKLYGIQANGIFLCLNFAPIFSFWNSQRVTGNFTNVLEEQIHFALKLSFVYQHNNYGCCLAQFFSWASANTFFFNFIIAKTIILLTEMVNFQVRLFENYISCIISWILILF